MSEAHYLPRWEVTFYHRLCWHQVIVEAWTPEGAHVYAEQTVQAEPDAAEWPIILLTLKELVS